MYPSLFFRLNFIRINRYLFAIVLSATAALFLMRACLRGAQKQSWSSVTSAIIPNESTIDASALLTDLLQTGPVSLLPASVMILCGIVAAVVSTTFRNPLRHACAISQGHAGASFSHSDVSFHEALSAVATVSDSHQVATFTPRSKPEPDASVESDETQQWTVEKLRTFSRVVQQSPASVVITDSKAKIVYVNPRFEEVSGYSAAEAIGQTPRILNSGIHPPEFYTEMWKTLGQGKIWRGEICNRHRSGELFWEDTSITAVFDDNGKIANYVGIKIDITTRKRMETQLNAQLESLEKMNRSLEELSQREKQTSQSLQNKIEELEAFNRIAIGREMRIIALKNEINQLCVANGGAPKYEIAK
ncbi:PAS domain-containing protein [Rhodopirellula sallentina]|uniref:PAS/PAC sensor hybrid histidine kinase n=1 Tax=Rhodopirellula sallentina SM41 TaxID=1263870 RepID=M5UH29_9BACT|nr:PAS domain S-box protein [Rhodopirellula sallentina]EMI57156.1 PAS/PAC sensor hybrid histidine kinase [Rhodopirellula sallentina SM41]